jgi:hypothetical protein
MTVYGNRYIKTVKLNVKKKITNFGATTDTVTHSLVFPKLRFSSLRAKF